MAIMLRHRSVTSTMSLIGELGDILRASDDLSRERRKTNQVAESVFGERETWMCAVCGRRKPQVPDVAAAHIVPLEEGGRTTPDNLIPLCEGTIRLSTALANVLDWYSRADKGESLLFGNGIIDGLGRKPDDIGCHKLLDSGLISRKVIREVSESTTKRGQYTHIRAAVFNTRLADLNAEFSPTSARRRTVARIKSGLARPSLSDDDWFDEVCKLISAARRLASPTFLRMAQTYCQKLHDSVRDGRRPSPKALSRFCYEEALLLMVRQPDPDLAGTLRLLERSCQYAEEAKTRSSWAMSRLEWVHAKNFASRTLNARVYNELLDAQNDAMEILAGKDEPKSANQIRWMMNGLMHRAQLQVKAKKMSEADLSLARARGLRESLMVATGWTQYQAVHLNTIEGAILALCKKYDDALRLLSRAVIPMRASRGKRPEGYLDIARCAAWTLKRLGRISDARKVTRIAGLMRDGRSGYWPHR